MEKIGSLSRRKMMKIGGAVGFAGIAPSSVSGNVIDSSENQNGRVHRLSRGFVEVGINVPRIEDARIGESCTFDRGFRTGNDGIYAGFPQNYLGLDTDSVVVANHHGLQSASTENTFIDGYIPISAPSRGGGVFAEGSLNWDPQIEITSESLELSVDGRTVRVSDDASATESFEVSGEYTSEDGKQKRIETTAKISVGHHGKKPFYVHDNQMLIPKNSAMGQFVAETVPEVENRKQIEIRPDSAEGQAEGRQVIEISNQAAIRSVPAYGMRVGAAEAGGAN